MQGTLLTDGDLAISQKVPLPEEGRGKSTWKGDRHLPSHPFLRIQLLLKLTKLNLVATVTIKKICLYTYSAGLPISDISW